jgi:phthiodiolone/phenolphthiodiolone dimycocerosates ketoreductase
MLKMCGRYADGWLPGQKVGADEYASRLAVIRDAADEAKRSMRRFTASQTLLLALGDSRDHVLDLALENKYCAYMAMGLPPAVWSECGLEHPMGADFMGFLDLVPSRVTPEQVQTALDRINVALLDRLFYIGTPKDILAEAAPLASAGCSHFIVANMGAAFTGRGLADVRDLWSVMRSLRRLDAPSVAD